MSVNIPQKSTRDQQEQVNNRVTPEGAQVPRPRLTQKRPALESEEEAQPPKKKKKWLRWVAAGVTGVGGSMPFWPTWLS
jgi:hypothetical protein